MKQITYREALELNRQKDKALYLIFTSNESYDSERMRMFVASYEYYFQKYDIYYRRLDEENKRRVDAVVALKSMDKYRNACNYKNTVGAYDWEYIQQLNHIKVSLALGLFTMPSSIDIQLFDDFVEGVEEVFDEIEDY